MDRRRFIKMGSCAATVNLPWLAACAAAHPLVVALHPWVGYETFFLAQELHWLPAGVSLVRGQSVNDSLAALRAGTVNAACLTLDEVLRARIGGLDLAVALVFDVSAGADAVLARPGLTHPEHLAGKRLGVERNSVSELVLRAVLAAGKLKDSSLNIIHVPPDEQVAAWRENRIDALVTYEPTSSLLRREGARTLFDSRSMPDMIIDVLAVDRRRPPAIESLLALTNAHFKALDHVQGHREDAVLRIAALHGVDPDEIRQTLAGIVQPTLAANRQYLSGSDPELLRAARSLMPLLIEHGLLTRGESLDTLLFSNSLPVVS